MKKVSIFCLVVLTAAGAYAQQAAPSPQVAPSPAAPGSPPPLPPGPLLKPVPDNTKWTITSVGKVPPNAKPEEKAAASTTTVGERMGKTVHILTVGGNGVREERWTDGKLLATMNASMKEPMFMTAAIDRISLPGWISAANFTEIKNQGGKDYLIFRTKILPTGLEIVQDMDHPGQIDTEKLKVDAIATIDGDTRLPVAVKEGETTTTYKFEPLAPGTEVVPATLLADLAGREKKMQDSIRKPVHP